MIKSIFSGLKRFRIETKHLARTLLAALLILGAAQFLMNWFGPFTFNFFGISALVKSPAGPAAAAFAFLALGVLRPRWIWNRRTFLIIIACIIANVIYMRSATDDFPPLKNAPCPAEEFAGSHENYNLVLISLDSLRADRLGAYGNTNDTSPWMDRLAAEGVLFEKCYSAAPATLISHATMFTGLYPGAHGAQCMTYEPLPKSALTLTEILQMNGYRTGGFTGGAQISKFFGFSQGFEVYNDDGGGMAKILPRALEWINNAGEDKFFLFLHSYDIHHPYEPPPPFNKMFFPDYTGPLGASIPIKLINDINSGAVKITQRDARYISSVYDGGIRYTDQFIGQLYEYLKEKELLEKTLIVLTSDHGEEFDEHGVIGTHAHTVYDELLRVPMILRTPGARPARPAKVNERVGLVDLPPTLLDLLGVVYPEKTFQGVSFAAMMGGSDPCGNPPRLQLAEKEYLPAETWGRMKAVRNGDWKLKLLNEPPWKRRVIRALGGFVYPVAGKELYNVKEDPGERHNVLIGNINTARSMEALLYAMSAWNAENRIEADPDKLKLNREEAQRLKNLGYVK